MTARSTLMSYEASFKQIKVINAINLNYSFKLNVRQKKLFSDVLAAMKY